MHKNAYGLSRIERDRLVRMAKSGLYYEHYLSNKFGITDVAVRDICAREGNYVCKWLDDNLVHHYNEEYIEESTYLAMIDRLMTLKQFAFEDCGDC